MFIALLAIAMNSARWLSTTATTTATLMALAASNHINPEIINALMMESLRSNFVQACDNERITLHCPKNTQILFDKIFYGRLVASDQLCPSTSTHRQFAPSDDISCDVVQAHAKILEQCRSRRKCKIVVEPSFFGTDPCPETFKYLQISYKCKPVSFDEELFCEGSTMQLSCKQNKRLVIYSAHYGRMVQGQVMHCAPNTPVSQDCMIDVLDRILYDCHARTQCAVLVNDEELGKSGCGPTIHKYLNLIFMCMNDEIFSEAATTGNLAAMQKIISSLPPMKLRKVLVKDDERTFHIKDDPGNGHKITPIGRNQNANAMPNSLSMNSDEKSEEGRGAFVVANPIDTTSSSVDRSFNAFGFMRDVVLIARTMKDNKGKVLICLLLSVVTGLAMLMIACVISGCYQRRMKRRKNSGMRNGEETVEIAKSTELNTLMRSNHLPSVFLDSNSRICFDIGDLSNNRESFLRFTQLTPPRVPQNMHGYS